MVKPTRSRRTLRRAARTIRRVGRRTDASKSATPTTECAAAAPGVCSEPHLPAAKASSRSHASLIVSGGDGEGQSQVALAGRTEGRAGNRGEVVLLQQLGRQIPGVQSPVL